MSNVLKSYDPVAVQLIGDGDKAFLREMLELFIRNTNTSLQGLTTAVEKRNFSLAASLSHKMRGPVNHLGAEKLSASLKRLEDLCVQPTVNPNDVVPLLQQTQQQCDQLIHELSSDWNIAK
mgnify:CR=1 FL=1